MTIAAFQTVERLETAVGLGDAPSANQSFVAEIQLYRRAVGKTLICGNILEKSAMCSIDLVSPVSPAWEMPLLQNDSLLDHALTMEPDLDLNHLEIVVKVVETRSVTRAAEAIGVPKSKVSRAITRLESDLDVPLFYRTARSREPTSVGQQLFSRWL